MTTQLPNRTPSSPAEVIEMLLEEVSLNREGHAFDAVTTALLKTSAEVLAKGGGFDEAVSVARALRDEVLRLVSGAPFDNETEAIVTRSKRLLMADRGIPDPAASAPTLFDLADFACA